MRLWAALAFLALLAACAPAPELDVAERRANLPVALPPMKTFSTPRVTPAQRSNRAIASDFLDLTFELESGRKLPVLTRFEDPITLRVVGRGPSSLTTDLDRLLARFRNEAGITITRVPASEDASITVEVLTQRELQRAVPQAACFVVPNVTGWEDFKRNRRDDRLDWTRLRERKRMAVFLPGDVSPQEVRDCLHEEIAQAIGPLNDLYRLPDSVFNDDNFHTVLTGFDMLILRMIYAPELRSGMTRDEVASRLPTILARENPRGRNRGLPPAPKTTRDWIDAIETALGPRTSPSRRRAAAQEAVRISSEAGWNDTRYAFSLFALGRLSLATDPEIALAAFLQSGTIYATGPDMDIQGAHVAMQLAAFALSAGQTETTLGIVNANLPAVADAENAALLATLLLVKAEALELQGKVQDAETVRLDSLGWAQYGFGSEEEVRLRASEISTLSPRTRMGSGT